MDKRAQPPAKRKPQGKKPLPTARRKKSGPGNVVFGIIFAATLLVALAFGPQAKKSLPRAGISPTIPHYDLPHDTPKLDVLFLGNSYTTVNDLPQMVAAVAASDTANPVRIHAGMTALWGITLIDLWDDQGAQEALHRQHWDYVVLQEQSTVTCNPVSAAQMYQAMVNWSTEISHLGARTIVYGTWARKPGSDWYTNTQKYPGLNLVSPEVMQDTIDKVTNGITAQIGATIVPVGDYWAICRDQPGIPDFYMADGSHPSLAGDYLIALLFYRALTGHKADNVSYIPDGISAAQAQLLKKCASYGS